MSTPAHSSLAPYTIRSMSSWSLGGAPVGCRAEPHTSPEMTKSSPSYRSWMWGDRRGLSAISPKRRSSSASKWSPMDWWCPVPDAGGSDTPRIERGGSGRSSEAPMLHVASPIPHRGVPSEGRSPGGTVGGSPGKWTLLGTGPAPNVSEVRRPKPKRRNPKTDVVTVRKWQTFRGSGGGDLETGTL